ncbi:glycosyltransferase family 4 protein [Aliiglaciecola sp. NS0011-25]|uniref:glycosyltransferase family 4 protein n=1 Tax=Aliiglaciecola sp. NS0011-25 TaxID=3127654 RepID=UPI003107077A
MHTNTPKKLRNVLIISYQYPPDVGGAGSVAKDIANLIQNECNLTLVTLDTGHDIEETFQVIRAKTKWPVRFIGFWNTLKKLELSQYDDIIVNDTGASLVASLYFPAELKSKCWVYLHGSEPENIYIHPELMYKLLGFKYKYTNLIKESKYVIAVSEFMKQKFISMTQLPQLTDKISVITNGIDEKLFKPHDTDLRTSLGISNDTKIMLSVSRLTPKKGYIRKLRLFKTLSETQSLFWIIIGNGPFAEELRSLVEQANLQHSILILEGIKRDQLIEYYSAADLFWLLSEYDESFGLVYLEANFCGCPAIGNKKGGIPFIIDEGINGFTVDQTNDQTALSTITQALDSKRFNRGEIIEYVKKYSINKTKNSLLHFLSQ